MHLAISVFHEPIEARNGIPTVTVLSKSNMLCPFNITLSIQRNSSACIAFLSTWIKVRNGRTEFWQFQNGIQVGKRQSSPELNQRPWWRLDYRSGVRLLDHGALLILLLLTLKQFKRLCWWRNLHWNATHLNGLCLKKKISEWERHLKRSLHRLLALLHLPSSEVPEVNVKYMAWTST